MGPTRTLSDLLQTLKNPDSSLTMWCTVTTIPSIIRGLVSSYMNLPDVHCQPAGSRDAPAISTCANSPCRHFTRALSTHMSCTGSAYVPFKCHATKRYYTPNVLNSGFSCNKQVSYRTKERKIPASQCSRVMLCYREPWEGIACHMLRQ